MLFELACIDKNTNTNTCKEKFIYALASGHIVVWRIHVPSHVSHSSAVVLFSSRISILQLARERGNCVNSITTILQEIARRESVIKPTWTARGFRVKGSF